MVVQRSSAMEPLYGLKPAANENRSPPFGAANEIRKAHASTAAMAVALTWMGLLLAPLPPAHAESTQTLAVKVETLDFSMPSYDQATKERELKFGTTSSPPSFNPFGDFEPSVKDDTSAADKKAEEERKEQEKKDAAERKQKEEEEKQAEIARKKAEKEARLQAEREKQKAAAERAAAEKAKEAEASSKPVEIKMPEFDTSSFKAPDIKVPDFKAPDMDFKAPDIKIPDIKVPDFKAPDMSKVSMPKFDVPKFDMPKTDIPKFELPSDVSKNIPKFDLPDTGLPKIGLPSLPSFSPDPKEMENLAPQEVRDQIARDKRQIFLSADDDAKEAEAKAREIRAIANAKKKEFNAAKDEACKTRPGGKILCLRNPFNAGY